MTTVFRLWAAAWLMAWLFAGSVAPSLKPGRVLDCPPWQRWGGEYQDIVSHAALEAGVPVVILHRVILTESGYYPRALGRNLNGTIDMGICQLNSASLPFFEAVFNGGQPIDPYDPAQAIPIAARYLADNYRIFGSWWCAVAAYNAGAGRVLRRQIPASTVRYVAKVMR